MTDLIANTTKAERSPAHRAKMEAKKRARALGQSGFMPIKGRVSDALVAQAQLAGRPIKLHPSRIRLDRLRASLPAEANRHTGKPHEHRREIARRLRQQGRG